MRSPEPEKLGCICWFCSFGESQKLQVNELARRYADRLYERYEGRTKYHKCLVGAYAEVVFGAKFNLLDELWRDRLGDHCLGDDGIDFCARRPEGLIAIDVKGSEYSGLHLSNRIDSQIYVLIQVVDLRHAFFRGFAFGSDDFVPSPLAGKWSPRQLRPLEELMQMQIRPL